MTSQSSTQPLMNNSLTEFTPIIQLSTNTILDSQKDKKFKNVIWTIDVKTELPIFLTKSGFGAVPAQTVIDIFEEVTSISPKEDALFIERGGNNNWISWTWNHYHKEVTFFAKALINVGIEPYRTVNILGYNAPEWFAAFMGGIYACVVPTGIYNTNNAETCMYIAEHSEMGCLVVDSIAQYKKYEKDLSRLKHLKAVVIFGETTKEEDIKALVNPYVTIYLWKDFIEVGRRANVDLEFEDRKRMQKPGNACDIVYTSGTTGTPKAVLLSHDNLVWTAKNLYINYKNLIGEKNKGVSYLPLSHIAGQINDIFLSLVSKSQMYFARPDALSGSLVETLKFVQPTAFFAVPRVYEKFEDRIREVLSHGSFIKKKIIKGAMKTGSKYVDNSLAGKNKPVMFPVAKYLVFNKIRKALGFMETKSFAFGAAPLKKKTLEFFKSLGMPIHNTYGMSESTGPQFLNFPIDGYKPEIYAVGIPMAGTDARIMNQDKDGVGEICYRGRNRFMGYYKNESATLEAIDEEGFLHSGDQGCISKTGNLLITGRIKELIVTAGGENVAPVPIEESFKEICKIISNVVVLGDDKKYLAALITLKTDHDGNLTKEVLDLIREINSEATTVVEALNCDKIKFYIQKSFDEVNKKAVSRAQVIRKWTILPQEFTIDGGEMTPTLKIKRKIINQKYSKIIDQMYSDPKF